ncbi:hypothetical protein [Streptomyces sp. NPDC088141]|uniref:hypothetical protein n=1 Tax=unclassified Streptomyces TaxID=2593676 RepID=UPI0034478791
MTLHEFFHNALPGGVIQCPGRHHAHDLVVDLASEAVEVWPEIPHEHLVRGITEAILGLFAFRLSALLRVRRHKYRRMDPVRAGHMSGRGC